MQPQGDLVPQNQPLFIPRPGRPNQQVENKAGGWVFEVDDMKRLLRFIIMGTEGGTYYVKEKELERGNVSCIDRLISKGKGVEVVQTIKDVSVSRRNVKQNSLLLAYAICARSNDKDTKKAAYSLLSDICRIPTHLFMFVKYCEQESKSENDSGTGWGRAHKRAVSNWYTNFQKNPEKLARLVTKFKNRESWCHKDVLRLAHTSTQDRAVGFILRYITKGLDKARDMYIQNATEMDDETRQELSKLSNLIQVFDTAINVTNEEQLCSMIREHKLTWEQCNSELLKSKQVWIALLPHMPIEATIRNLARMTSYGLFAENSEDEEMVLDKIRSINTLSETPMEVANQDDDSMEVDNAVPEGGQGRDGQKRQNVLHPFKILLALLTYKTGKGDKGSLTWKPNPRILEALNQAFYQAFEAVEPTGKKYYLAVDVSGSMSQPVLGSNNIHCSQAAAAMMMVTARTEENCIIRGFSHQLVDIPVKVTDTIEMVEKKMDSIPMGGTDCAKPMFDAIEKHIKDIDVFVVYTDNETWFGKVHPCEALRQYRQYSGRNSVKLIVCGMCSTEFTIADQQDRNMLDVVGFDSAAPRLIAEFSMDKL